MSPKWFLQYQNIRSRRKPIKIQNGSVQCQCTAVSPPYSMLKYSMYVLLFCSIFIKAREKINSHISLQWHDVLNI